MRIGEVASHTGVSVQTVRLYERRGLLKKPVRLPSGYRDYPIDALSFIRFIKRAQGHGFTLDEIRSLIHLREQSPPAAKQMRNGIYLVLVHDGRADGYGTRALAIG